MSIKFMFKTKIARISGIVSVMLCCVFLSAPSAWAIQLAPGSNSGGSTPTADQGSGSTGGTSKCAQNDVFCANPPCTSSSNGSSCTDPAATNTCQNVASHNNCDIISDYINPVINILSGLVGLVAVMALIYSGIQYSMAGGDAQKVQKSKNRIRATLIGVVTYAFFYGFVQFMVPGGLLNK